jgi:hypothetical protein
MKNLMILLTLIVSAQARADIYAYEANLPNMVRNYLGEVDGAIGFRKQDGCENMYGNMLKDGVLDITYAFGYFDDTNGQDRIEGGVNYGPSPSLDIAAFRSLRSVLRETCQGPNSLLCNFAESGDPSSGKLVFQKNIKMMGQKILVRITMTQASASEKWASNKGELAGRQKFLTQQSEASYFGALKTSSDIVFYNGHSRNGGGPDFMMPVLNSSNHTDYKGWYEIQRVGIKHALANLAANPNKGVVVGLFSCYSRKHFLDNFLSQNPNQRLILSADTIDYFDTLKTSAGYLEGMMHGLCGDNLDKVAKRGNEITGFQAWNLK